MRPKIVFITGTDTGVGKTLLTALLLCHLRARGGRALALKPFCSGTRADAQLLHDLQDGDLTLEEVNPFYFPEPVAPVVSARKHKRLIPLNQVVQHINSVASCLSCLPTQVSSRSLIKNSKLRIKNYLLIEGSGGLLVPLGEGYTVLDFITRLDCEVIIVSRNRLGTINHTLLTVQCLLPPRTTHHASRATPAALKVVLMGSSTSDSSSSSNAAILCELLEPIPLVQVPFLGSPSCSLESMKKTAGNLGRILARILSGAACE